MYLVLSLDESALLFIVGVLFGVLDNTFSLLFGRQRIEITSPTGAEVDLPTPETPDDRLGVLVILST